MRSSIPFLFCRICGTRYRSDKVDQHEKSCAKLSQSSSVLGEARESESNVFLKEIPSSKSSLRNSNKKTSSSQLEIEKVSSGEEENKQDHVSTFTNNETDSEVVSKEKEKINKIPYPESSSHLNVNQVSSRSSSVTFKPKVSKEPGENAKQAWNANAKRKLSAKSPEPRPTKKYRHYPISCEFCNKKMQPGPLRKHILKYHTEVDSSPDLENSEGNNLEEDKSTKQKMKSSPRFRICYICGRQFGSKSLPIHEPKCLEKWRIQNEKLPKNKRMPEPVKPETEKALPSENLPGAEEYKLPEYNQENLAAYQSHLKNLVPCSFCGRKFTPDRVMVHEGACIKRPKKRTYQTPEKDKA